MTSKLGRVTVTRKSGRERLRAGSKEHAIDLLSFWQWSASDLLSNATRGVLAEYIVACALDVDVSGVREEWAAYDLTTRDGVRVEVKSAAFLQTWHQERLSRISFVVPKTRAWDPLTNLLSTQSCRQADVYVFALLAHQDKDTVNPLDTSQWVFYVLPTAVLDGRTRSQHSITLASLCALCDRALSYHELRAAVAEAVKFKSEPPNPGPQPDDTAGAVPRG